LCNGVGVVSEPQRLDRGPLAAGITSSNDEDMQAPAGNLLTVAGGGLGSQPMGEERPQEFGGMTAQLVDLIHFASTALSRATAALFSTDAPAAESVAVAYDAVSALRDELEDHTAALLAFRAQSGVPDLRATIAAVHVNAEAEHMGQLARGVADNTQTRRAWASIPAASGGAS